MDPADHVKLTFHTKLTVHQRAKCFRFSWYEYSMLHRCLCLLSQLKKLHFYAFPHTYEKASNITNTLKIPWPRSNVSNGTRDTYMLGNIPATGCSFWALLTSHEPSCPLNKNLTKFHICLLNSHPTIFIIHS
jgi:hypothetical protein